jgi:hypothetical protein
MVGYPETSVKNYHYSLRNNTEKRSSPRQIAPTKLSVITQDCKQDKMLVLLLKVRVMVIETFLLSAA